MPLRNQYHFHRHHRAVVTAFTNGNDSMKLHQYIQAFTQPLAVQDPNELIRLLDARNKLARGLKDTVGPIDVSAVLASGF